VSQSSTTPLASGTLNGHDQLIIELVESTDPRGTPNRCRGSLAEQSNRVHARCLRSGLRQCDAVVGEREYDTRRHQGLEEVVMIGLRPT
jgi:hypothetical protein